MCLEHPSITLTNKTGYPFADENSKYTTIVYVCSECGEVFLCEDSAEECCGEHGEEVTACCHSEIGARTVRERGSYYTNEYEVECCVDCGKEVES